MELEKGVEVYPTAKVCLGQILVVVPPGVYRKGRVCGGSPRGSVLGPTGGCAGKENEATGLAHSGHIGKCLEPVRVVLETLERADRVVVIVGSAEVLALGHVVDAGALGKVNSDVIATGEEVPHAAVDIKTADFEDLLTVEAVWEFQLEAADELLLLRVSHVVGRL